MSRARLSSHPPGGPNGGTSGGETNQNRNKAARSRRRPATTVRVLAFLALFFVAVLIAADTLGRNLAGSDPNGALQLAPWEPAALDELARRQLSGTNEELKSVEDL